MIRAKIPLEVDLSIYCPEIRSQGSTSFCHSFAGAFLTDMTFKVMGLSNYITSPLDIAKRAKNEDIEHPNREGTDLYRVARVLVNDGCCQEVDYPFSKYRPSSLDFPKQRKIQRSYPFQSFYRTIDIEDIQEAIALNRPVIFSILISDLFQYTYDIIHIPTTNIVGLHAMVIVGYNETGFKVANSFGTSWGINGFSTISYEYFKSRAKVHGELLQLFTGDAWAFIIDNEIVQK